jgi:tripartite-type tricarboxylate transporter receptor subunit TctC
MYARIMAPYFGRHLPGKPAVIVDNMPGAGGLVAVNYLAQQAPRDGTTIELVGLQALLSQMLGEPGAQFDVRTFVPLGAPSREIGTCVFSKASGIDLTAWQHSKTPPRLGITNYGSTSHVVLAMLAGALGLSYRPVVGYKGTADIRFAMVNRELDGVCVGSNSYLSSFEPRSDFVVAVQAGGASHPLLKDAPSAAEYVHDERGRELLDVLGMMGAAGRFYVAPPGTPPDLVASLRKAFDETMHDAEFLEAARAGSLEIEPVDASVVQQRVASLLNLPADVRQRVTAILTDHQGS